METFALWTTLLVLVGVSALLLGALVRSILKERRSSGVRRIWPNFGLGIAFALLFVISWAAQGVTEWSSYQKDQAAHGETAQLSDFWVEFGQSNARELAVRVPPAVLVRRPVGGADPPGQRRVQGRDRSDREDGERDPPDPRGLGRLAVGAVRFTVTGASLGLRNQFLADLLGDVAPSEWAA